MRRLTLSMLLGLGTLGLTFANPAQAKASWLSEALDRHPIQVTVAPTSSYYPPAYVPAPTYAPSYAPSYNTYAPVPSYYNSYAPAPVIQPVPVCPPTRPVFVPRPVERYPVRTDYRHYEWNREPYRHW